MKITEDNEKFDELQITLVKNLVQVVKGDLGNAPIDNALRDDLAGRISFSICSILDGATTLEHKGKPLTPFIGLATDDDGEDIVTSESGSWMHEYVFGAVGPEEPVEDESNEAQDESSEDLEGVDESYSVILKFATGLKVCVNVWDFQPKKEIAEEIGSSLHFLMTCEREDLPSSMRKTPIGDMCSAFADIESLDFLTSDLRPKAKITVTNLSRLTIGGMASRIHKELGAIRAANKPEAGNGGKPSGDERSP